MLWTNLRLEKGNPNVLRVIQALSDLQSEIIKWPSVTQFPVLAQGFQDKKQDFLVLSGL